MKTASLQIACTYATALFELARDKDLVDQIMGDLRSFADLLERHDLLLKALTSPAIPTTLQQELIFRITNGRLNELTTRFLMCVAEHGRMALFSAIMQAFGKMVDGYLGIVEISVELASQPDANKLDLLSRELSNRLNRPIRLLVKADPGIIGGIIIRFNGVVIDNSLKGRLGRAIRQLRAGVKEAYNGL